MQQNRLELERDIVTAADPGFANDVRRGLTALPKFLSPKYFYDDLGSKLFESICLLPEYYLTRAETEILVTHGDEIARSLNGPVRLVELGSGSSQKTRLLIQALLANQNELSYQPIDISETTLSESARALENDYPRLHVTPVAGDYTKSLDLPHRAENERVLVLFLGSNIGNYNKVEALALLRTLRAALSEGDGLLIGADLKKPESELIAAYDDPIGVTAAFNLNVLARINRELGGDFDVREFVHRAIYNEREGRMEMYLVSRSAVQVRIRALDLDVSFEEDEVIHTENSYKFQREELEDLSRRAGFEVRNVWLDSGARFSSNLWVAVNGQ